MASDRPNTRPRPVIAAAAVAVIIAVALVVITVNPAYPGHATSAQPPGSGALSHAPAPHVATADVLPTVTASYLGTHEGDVPNSYALTTRFQHAVGRRPNIVLYYSGWPERFQTQFAQTARRHGAVLLVDLNPGTVPLRSIADGRQDSFITDYADQIRAYGHPVLLSFAHEMNGTWYPWGSGHATPAEFIAAWRHIVDVFRAQGADNVTWVWAVNTFSDGSHPVAQWYPGRAYVNWVGIDGYETTPANTFGNTFAKTLAQVRAVAPHKPVLMSEIAIGPRAGQLSKMQNLFTSITRDHLLGLVWFDKNQNNGAEHQAWRLEDNPAAVRAFRVDLRHDFAPLAQVGR